MTFRVQETQGDTSNHPDQVGEIPFSIDLGETPFGLLYITPRTYTLAWEGSVDFLELEKEVFQALAIATGSPYADFGDLELRNRTSVALGFPLKDGSDRLEKYRLKEPTEYSDYSLALKNPGAINFARYDFSDNALADPYFSFMAENAALESEVALQIAKSYSCTKDLLRWMLAHHERYRLLVHQLDLEPSVSTINRHISRK